MVAEVLNKCSSSSRALAILGDGGRVEENLAHLRYYLDKDLEVVRRIAARSGLDLGVLGELVEDYRPAP